MSRFEAKQKLWCTKVAPKLVTTETGCMEWPLACIFKGQNSYGVIGCKSVYADKNILVHKLSLEVSLGRELNPKELALHTCDNKRCANPAHLYAGSYTQNIKDAWARGLRKIQRENAILTEDQVIECRILFYNFAVPRKELAKWYGLSYGGMDALIACRNWKAVG